MLQSLAPIVGGRQAHRLEDLGPHLWGFLSDNLSGLDDDTILLTDRTVELWE